MKKTLVILAGGLGSRFGGLKQIEPIGNNGEFIIDYSIYDAIQAGFKEVIFIIKKENYKVFKNTDFYGQNSFKLASEILEYDKEIEIISYKLGQTLTENGAVKRGICYEDENNNVLKIIESICERKDNKIIVKNLDGTDERSVDENMNVSMLMMTMNKDVLSLLNQKVDKFIKNLNGDLTSEILIPVVLNELLKEKSIKIKTKETDEKWYGITYREDLEKIKNIIKEKQEKGEYPIQLWK